jgi:hypothetical protein
MFEGNFWLKSCNIFKLPSFPTPFHQNCLTTFHKNSIQTPKSRHFHVHIMSKTIERLRKMLKNYPKLPATNQKLSISRSTENQP